MKPEFMFVAITPDDYNLLDADSHNLPRIDWKVDGNLMVHESGMFMDICPSNEQPEDVYLLGCCNLLNAPEYMKTI